MRADAEEEEEELTTESTAFPALGGRGGAATATSAGVWHVDGM